MKVFPFHDLREADLIVGARYCGDPASNQIQSEPLAPLMRVGNQGGIRFPSHRRFAVLYTTWGDPDWPDFADNELGTLTYFGDNKRPGRDLHSTRGNQLLRDVFSALIERDFRSIPPIFLFSRFGPGEGRDVRFEGLLVPGLNGTPPSEALSAIWRTKDGQPFQNYRASFTFLDEGVVARRWLNSLVDGGHAPGPKSFEQFRRSGRYRARRAPRSVSDHRTQSEQLPTGDERKMIESIHDWFKTRPHDFERCAMDIWRMLAPATTMIEQTRQSRDGGRDAIGTYSIGPSADRVALEFALEAKCWTPGRAIGVKEVARLVSRLKHRQFGVLVTTSFVGEQAYKEVREDGHPVAFVCAADIVAALKSAGITTAALTSEWLEESYPLT